MDDCRPATFEGNNKKDTINGAEAKFQMMETEKQLNQGIGFLRYETINMESPEGFAVKQKVDSGIDDIAGEVNMETAITADDVIRAGGFGATDNIGSVLPVAMDSTDFEASLRDARDFEESGEERSRPGLGWTEPNGTKCSN